MKNAMKKYKGQFNETNEFKNKQEIPIQKGGCTLRVTHEHTLTEICVLLSSFFFFMRVLNGEQY